MSLSKAGTAAQKSIAKVEVNPAVASQLKLDPHGFGDRMDIFVATPRQADQDKLILSHRLRLLADVGDGVSALQSRDNPFELG